MNNNDINITKVSKLKKLADFSNEFDINPTSLNIFHPVDNSFIQISPNNKLIAFYQNNSLDLYEKINNDWKKKLQHFIYFEKIKIKGINWSPDNKMILIYGDNNKYINENNKERIEYKSTIKIINLDDLTWVFEISYKGILNYASFYPDSRNIVYIKSPINILNIFCLSNKSESGKYQNNSYYYIKYDDKRSINYIEKNKNIYTIISCYGRSITDMNNKVIIKEPSDYIIILVNKKVFKCFPLFTKDLDRIIPIKNNYCFFIAIEKEFYKYPFFIYNLFGEIIFKSEFSKEGIQTKLTNPCLLYNKFKETNFIVVQKEEGTLEIFGCQSILSRSEIYYFYDYNKLYNNNENFKKNYEINKNINKENDKNIYNKLSEIYQNNNYIDKNDILFLEEKDIKNNNRELIKVNHFEVDICYNENDYLLHSEISPEKNYICFINKKYPKYLFFSTYYQSGVFKIIKFINDIICFKWSTQQDMLFVTLDSKFFYLITKDHYICYNLEKKYNFDNITWSPYGKEIILSNEEENIRLLVILK